MLSVQVLAMYTSAQEISQFTAHWKSIAIYICHTITALQLKICRELHLLIVHHSALTRNELRKNLLSPNSLVLIDGGNQGIAICSIF